MKAAAIAIGCAIAAGFAMRPVSAIVHPSVSPAGLEAQDTHASASLLGQFRSSAASYLYLHADLYLHNGVELRPLTHSEESSGRAGVGSSDHLLEEDDKNVTAVPDKRHDFRGWMGDVERETSNFKDMKNHSHLNPMMSLPLYRLMTLVDPQFIPGWTVGAQIMSGEKTKLTTRRALGYLASGLEQNPDCIDILVQIGMTHAVNERDYPTAIKYLERARVVGKSRKHLGEAEETALSHAYDWLAIIHKDWGTDFDRLYIAREGAARFPDDPILARLSQ